MRKSATTNKEGSKMSYKASEALKEIRAIARKSGLTFKKIDRLRIGGKQAYEFVDRVSGASRFTNCSFLSAYEHCMSGFIETYNPKTGRF